MREVAALSQMDPTLLSKIERGSRLPTVGQLSGLAKHFGVAEDEIQAQRIAIDFLSRYGNHRSVELAVAVIQQSLSRSETESTSQRSEPP